MKLIVLSNRGPFSIEPTVSGELRLKQNIGGLATSLHSYLNKCSLFTPDETIWIHTTETRLSESSARHLEDHYRVKPIFIEPDIYDPFYNICCNQQIYPSLLNILDCYTEDANSICDYQRVNAHVRDAILEIYEPGDLIWIHDYHFLLLPKLLRQALPDSYLMFFLHTPFPDYALFARKLPIVFSTEILESLLCADDIGFQTERYSRNFIECLYKQLPLIDADSRSIKYKGKTTKIKSHAISVDFEYYDQLSTQSIFSSERQRLLDSNGREKIILSVDRLDPSKGLINKLDAFDLFLTGNPEYLHKISFIFIVTPSREEISYNKRLLEQIRLKVDHINSKFDVVEPLVKFKYRRYTIDELIIFYNITDILLITSLYDGVNLITKEYIASRYNHDGVVILSEFAGASAELSDALIVNPYDPKDISDKIRLAATMSSATQQVKMRNMRNVVRLNDIQKWGNDILGEYFRRRNKELIILS
jgi:trehalose 6-phosphate synthase/phosphatase